MRPIFISLALIVVLLSIISSAAGQTSDGSPDGAGDASTATAPRPPAKTFISRKIIRDQKYIWRAPVRFVHDNYKVLVPVAIAAAALIATDRFTSNWVDQPGMLRPASRTISRAGGPAASMAAAAGLYLVGRATEHKRLERTGLLSAEA